MFIDYEDPKSSWSVRWCFHWLWGRSNEFMICEVTCSLIMRTVQRVHDLWGDVFIDYEDGPMSSWSVRWCVHWFHILYSLYCIGVTTNIYKSFFLPSSKYFDTFTYFKTIEYRIVVTANPDLRGTTPCKGLSQLFFIGFERSRACWKGHQRCIGKGI